MIARGAVNAALTRAADAEGRLAFGEPESETACRHALRLERARVELDELPAPTLVLDFTDAAPSTKGHHT